MTSPIESSRLNLSPFAIIDTDALFLMRRDAETMRYWDWPVDETRAETQFVAQKMLGDMEAGAAKIWAVRLSDGTFIGIVDLSEIANREADLGFMIARDHWGKGYGFGAGMLAILNAHAMGLTRLKARIHADNQRSRKLLERLGFTAGETRDVEIRRGVVKPCQFFVLDNPGARFAQGSSSLSQ